MAKRKKKGVGVLDIVIPLLIIIFSLGCLVYPFISNYIFENRADGVITTYEEQVEELAEDDLSDLLKEAQEYNAALVKAHVTLTDPFIATNATEAEYNYDYNKILKQDGTDIMCSIEIPKIDVNLPVYHGTSEAVLAIGVGHLEGSSMPVGGESTHCVLSAHTGSSNAKLFTDLTEMEAGDRFYIHVLNDTLAYEVDDISVVEPEDISKLSVISGEDHVTLVTCTPYGVNTHRLLVRGTRVEYTPETIEEDRAATDVSIFSSNSQWMGEYVKALAAGIGLVVGIAYLTFIVVRLKRWRSLK